MTSGRGVIPVEPFQRRIAELVAEGATYADLAVRAGFIRPPEGDGHRLKRAVGLVPYSTHGEHGHRTERVGLAQAARLCEALDMDPVDVGL